MSRKAELLSAIVILIGIAGRTSAADPDDPPSRVARLNYLNGTVSFRSGNVDDWSEAALNYPLTTGDHLWTDTGARAEMRIGPNGIRMAPRTAASFLTLDDRTLQLSVTEGSVNIRLRSLGEDETFEVDTPNAAITLLRSGDYRIDADGDNNTTIVTVRGGDVAVTIAGAAFPMHVRQSARIIGMDSVTYEIGPAPALDAFDQWCLDRESRFERVDSVQYVSPEMTGYEDLDQNGVWREEQQYGWVWVPHVEVGWVPYRYGRWVWVDPWGWTWVDDAPWGFAPFHYGRWAVVGGVWVWIPGTRVARPVYAPALVVFVGGNNWGAEVAAWFPLGPHEVYRPGYRTSEFYVRQVNLTHVTNIAVNVTSVRYLNQGVPGAVTAVTRETFLASRPVGRGSLPVDAREAAQAPVTGMTAPVSPRREIVVETNRAIAPPTRIAQRTVVVKTEPAASAARSMIRVAAPPTGIDGPRQPQNTSAPRGGWRTFGQPPAEPPLPNRPNRPDEPRIDRTLRGAERPVPQQPVAPPSPRVERPAPQTPPVVPASPRQPAAAPPSTPLSPRQPAVQQEKRPESPRQERRSEQKERKEEKK